ncbi:hypothetical protein GCM10028786_26990 [Flaviaesturariibacter terrae]
MKADAQSAAVPAKVLDSTVSIFWYPDLKLRVQLLRPDEEDDTKKNAVLTLRNGKAGIGGLLLKDSIYITDIRFRLADMNGDGIRDLLVFRNVEGYNRHYYLYLIDQKTGRLSRVKGFEKVCDPMYDTKRCAIWGFEMFEAKLVERFWMVDNKGMMYVAAGVLKDRK